MRKTSYRPEFCEQLIQYADKPPTFLKKVRKWVQALGQQVQIEEDVAVPLPTLAGFARLIKVSKQTLFNWAEEYPDFKEALDYFYAIQEDIMIENGMAGRYEKTAYALIASSILRWRTGEVNYNVQMIKEIKQEDLDKMTMEDLQKEVDRRIGRG